MAAEILGEAQARGLAAEADGETEPQRVEPHAPGDAQAEEAGQQVERGGKSGAGERRRSLVVHVVDAQVVLHVEKVRGPGVAHEVEGGAVAGDHQVRAVVHVLAGSGVAVRGRAAPQHAAPLEQQHVVALLLEADGGREAGEPAPHHDDPHRRKYTRGTVRRAIQAFRGRDKRAAGRPTGQSRRAISSSRAR